MKAPRNARSDEARERLDAAVASLVDGDQWKRWLETRARFHNYSFANCLLIASQRPTASRVAGYRAWQALDRQVKKGEHGIAIFAPIFVRPKATDGTVDPDGEKQLRFRIVYVFDVDQTEGEPLPAVATLLTGDSGLTDAADSLIAHALWLGLTVDRDDAGPANGFLDGEAKRIVLDLGLDRDQALKTLIHELAHWHDLYEGRDERLASDRDAAEIVAESVAYVVGDALGLDTSSWSVGYVATWADGDLDKVRAVAERVDHAAKALLTWLDDDLAAPASTEEVAA